MVLGLLCLQCFFDRFHQSFVVLVGHKADADEAVTERGKGGTASDHHTLTDQDIKKLI